MIGNQLRISLSNIDRFFTLVAVDNKKYLPYFFSTTFFSTQITQILKIFADKAEQAFTKKSAQILIICVPKKFADYFGFCGGLYLKVNL
jgi:hypothetical protein